MKKGASDYLLKDRLGRLGESVKTALEHSRLMLERKAAQATLRESERRFREMMENMGLIAMILDLQGVVTVCNEPPC